MTLALLCRFHHTLIHEHNYRLIPEPGGFSARRPDRTPVPAYGPPTTGSIDDLIARHTAQNITIDDWTITPQWGGEPLDRDHTLTWLLPELHREATAA